MTDNTNSTPAEPKTSDLHAFLLNRIKVKTPGGAKIEWLELAHNDVWMMRELIEAATTHEQQLVAAAREVIRTELFFQDHPQKFAAQKALRAALVPFDGATPAPSDAMAKLAKTLTDAAEAYNAVGQEPGTTLAQAPHMSALNAMRTAFEAHYFADGEEIERKGDGYYLVGAQIAWDAWQKAYNAGIEAMAESDQIVFENAATRMQLLDDALTAYVRFAATRRTELGSLSPEMEVVDAQAVAALAGIEPQVPGIVAWFRQEQPFGRWVECTPFQPGAVRFAAKAFPSLRSLAKPIGSTQ